MATVSVVIPCYNLGPYVEEAVDSVLRQTFEDYDIIVVNDGSTDPVTVNVLQHLDKPKTTVLHTENAGVSMARNRGIEESSGRYILPLDADDRIGETYLEKAVTVLDRELETGVVYCRAEYFGERTGEMKLRECTPENMVNGNTIFCSAVFRRELWECVGGYNSNMKYDLEDWDFWLSLLEKGIKAHQLDEVLFFYRKRGGSRNLLLQDVDKISRMHAQVFLNHKDYFEQNIVSIFKRYYETLNKCDRYRKKLKRQSGFSRMVRFFFK
ncbi:MAG: glycosyltransferase family A protein [Planctomycetota bacterium]|jgi:glycosyltransferase involved in cell wall biosynthesis